MPTSPRSNRNARDWGADPLNPSRRLIAAASCGRHDEAVDALFLGANPSAVFEGGVNALMMACSNNHPALVELLAPISDPCMTDPFGNSYLHRAASYGHADCVLALLAQPWGSKQTTDLNAEGHAPFLSACLRGALDCVLALAPISDVHATDRHGKGAILLACANDSHEALEFLMTLLDPLEMDEAGRDGLQTCCATNSIECAKLMIAINDPNREDHSGKRALGILCENALMPNLASQSSWAKSSWDQSFSNEIEIAQLLISRGAWAGAKDGAGFDALSRAGASMRPDLAAPIFQAHLAQDSHGAFSSAMDALRSATSENFKSDLRLWIASAQEKIIFEDTLGNPPQGERVNSI